MPPEVPIGKVSLDFTLNGVNKFTKTLEDTHKKVQKLTSTAKKLTDTANKITSPMNNLDKKLSDINDKFKEWDDEIRKSRNRLSALSDNKLIKWFDDVIDRVIRIAKQKKTLEVMGGEFGVIRYKVRELWKVLGYAFGKGTFSKIGGLMSILTKLYGQFALLTSIALIFKTMWKYNIGGIQTLWHGFIGNLMTAWAKFDVKLRDTLRRLEPLFKAVLVPLFRFLNSFIVGFLDGFLEMLNVIGDLVEAFKPFFDVLDKVFKISDGLKTSTMGWARWLGKIAAYVTVFMAVMKVVSFFVGATNPITLFISLLLFALPLIIKHWRGIVDWVKRAYNWFLRINPIFRIQVMLVKFIWNTLSNFFKWLFENGDKIKSFFVGLFKFLKSVFTAWFNTIINPIKGLMNLFNKVRGLFKGAPKPENVITPTTTHQTNINNQPNITIYTSGINQGEAYRIGESLFNGLSKFIQGG